MFDNLFGTPVSDATSGDYWTGGSVPVHAGSYTDFATVDAVPATTGDVMTGGATACHPASFGEQMMGESTPISADVYHTLTVRGR